MSERICYRCKTWNKCPTYSYYEPGDIRFCPRQVIFLISIQEYLDEGLWPYEAKQEILPTKPVYRPNARFVTAADFNAELDVRMRNGGRDAQTLKHEVAVLHAVFETLSYAAKNALFYVSGNNRKKIKYGVWLSQKKWRKKL
jgi:hypothetical protein